MCMLKNHVFSGTPLGVQVGLSVCKKDADFVICSEKAKSPQNGQNDGLSENFMLSKVGLFTFLNQGAPPS